MSFKEWLYEELMNNGVIDDTFDEDEIDLNTLYTETELDEDSYDQYKREFEEHCALIGQEPIWDVE